MMIILLWCSIVSSTYFLMKTIQSVCNATQYSLYSGARLHRVPTFLWKPYKAYATRLNIHCRYKLTILSTKRDIFLFLINITHLSSFAQINFSLYCKKPRCKRYDCCFHSSRYSSQTSTRKRGQTSASGGFNPRRSSNRRGNFIISTHRIAFKIKVNIGCFILNDDNSTLVLDCIEHLLSYEKQAKRL